MAGRDGSALGINKFDGMDFTFWRMQIEDYLYSKKLHSPLLDMKPEGMKDDEWILLDKQVLRVGVESGLVNTIKQHRSQRGIREIIVGMMKIQSDMYDKPSANNKARSHE
ncbi:uncharacterized protein [Aristolochia californica]|uniref:uncharacterized protein n=1 Tax=Aristolochia californica TaxID=171875 RepID=UPI0035DC59C6